MSFVKNLGKYDLAKLLAARAATAEPKEGHGGGSFRFMASDAMYVKDVPTNLAAASDILGQALVNLGVEGVAVSTSSNSDRYVPVGTDQANAFFGSAVVFARSNKIPSAAALNEEILKIQREQEKGIAG